jgi:hypothetical protein
MNKITDLAKQLTTALSQFAKPPTVEVKDGEILIDKGSITVTTQKAQDGRKVVIGYSVGVAVPVPGIRTFRNGDPGYPDDVDVNEIAFTTMPQHVIRAVMEAWFKQVQQEVDEVLLGD